MFPKLSLLLAVILLPLTAASQPASPYFDIRAYGAVADEPTVVTDAIQNAVDDAHDAGGGIVYVPPGAFVSGTVRLRDNVTLYVEAGATLNASRNEADYDASSALIYGGDVQNVAIRGNGTIHGRAEHEYREAGGVDSFIAEETEMARRAGVDMRRWYKLPPVYRLVLFEHATGVTIEDVSLVNSPAWTVDLKFCERVYIRGVYITSSLAAGVNADGIDVDGSRDVVITNSIIETGDDAIVLKSNLDGEIRRNTENVTVTNCVLTSTSSALKIGTETFGDIRHIVFSDIVIRNSNRGLGIIMRDGGVVENVIFSNITLETDRKHYNWWGSGDPIWLVIRKRSESSPLGSIRNIVFENIIAHGQGSSRIEGFVPTESHPDGKMIENVRLDNVQLFMEPEDKPDKRADHAFEAHHVAGLTLEDVHVRWNEQETEPGWRSALYLHDLVDLRIDGFSGRQGLVGSDEPVIRIEQVVDARIDNAEALPGSSDLIDVTGSNDVRIGETVDAAGR